MEHKTRSDGKRIYPSTLKREIISFIRSGKTPAELGREYQIPIQNISKWNRQALQSEQQRYDGSKPDEMITKSDHLKVISDLEKQIKNLKRSLVNMTIDRDILKDATSMAEIIALMMQRKATIASIMEDHAGKVLF